MATLNLTGTETIGSNGYGYEFCVGQLDNGRWVGFAIGVSTDGSKGMFLFSQVAENHQLGMRNREAAVKLTGAIAQDPCNGYGGVTLWAVEPHLRGNPDDFRCGICQGVGCQGDCCDATDYCEEFKEPHSWTKQPNANCRTSSRRIRS